MDTAIGPTWIRQRSGLMIESRWHVEQTITPSGIRVTACAEVLTPEETEVEGDVERVEPADDAPPLCPTCQDHLARTVAVP